MRLSRHRLTVVGRRWGRQGCLCSLFIPEGNRLSAPSALSNYRPPAQRWAINTRQITCLCLVTATPKPSARHASPTHQSTVFKSLWKSARRSAKPCWKLQETFVSLTILVPVLPQRHHQSLFNELNQTRLEVRRFWPQPRQTRPTQPTVTR